MSENILEIKGLNKHFGPTYANKDIDFSLKRGEIRGLIGENGSGKSTLLSQIAGLYKPDSGEMFVDGAPYAPQSPMDANNHKISMVLQELGVVGTLPAGVNVYLGRTKEFSKFGVINMRKMYKAAEDEFTKWGLEMPPLNKNTGDMMIESRKMIELARALSIDPDILLLDEVTQSLSLNNRNELYKLIRRLKDMGRSIIVITHDIEEMIAITDTITVLRDGEVVGEVNSADTTADDIRMMMVGREVNGDYYRADMTPTYQDKVVFEVKDLSLGEELTDINFELHAGEILGFCGLSDSGIHTLGRTLYGIEKPTNGTICLKETGVLIKNPPQALKNNMGYVPKDRDNEALLINASIRDNFTLPSLDELKGVLGVLAPKKINGFASDNNTKMTVKSTGIGQKMDALSGGNKQKVNLGRWMAKDLKVLILDCPTRGVDVGVKAYIYSLLKEAKKTDLGIILISDELTEVLGMSDRLFVMKDGKVTKEIRRDEDFTEQSVIGVMI